MAVKFAQTHTPTHQVQAAQPQITPESLDQRQAMANALKQMAVSPKPINHWGEGAANILSGISGALRQRMIDKDRAKMKADEEQRAQLAQAQSADLMMGMLPGGGLPGQMGPGSTPATPSAAPQAARPGGINRTTLRRMLMNPNTRGFAEKYIQSQVQGDKPTTMQRNFRAAQKDPAFAQFMDRRRPTTNVNVNTGEKAFDKELGKQVAKDFVQWQQTGAKASQDIADLNIADNALDDPNLYTGTGGNAVLGLKRAAQTLFGVDVKGVASGELVQRVAAKSALAMKDQLPGPMSDADRQFLQSLPANLTTTPEGNRRIIKLGIAQKRWQIERAKAGLGFMRQNGGRDLPGVYSALAEIDYKWAQQFGGLVSGLRNEVQSPRKAPTVGTPMDAYKDRYGLE